MHVARRRVYYISGFDPRGARFYHQLCQSEAAQQQAVNGCRYEVSGRRNDGKLAAQWTVHTHADGQTTETRHVFLRWDDLIRDHWPTSRTRVMARLPAFYWHFLTGGVLRRTWGCGARPIFWIFLAPLLYALLALLVAGVAAGVSGVVLRLANLPVWMATAAAALAAAALLRGALTRADDARLFWLSRIHLFMLDWGRTGPEPFAQRWAAFAARIQDDLAADTEDSRPDEVLIVGHSVGAVAAVAVAERWLALQPAGHAPAVPVKLLTLGQVIPMLGLIPQARWFRDQLSVVSACALPWLDMTAPADPLCYALVDPAAACGLAPVTRSDYRLRSARFDRMFAPADYAQLRRDVFRIHFQYLMATRKPVDNDFFHLTCGTRPLAVHRPGIDPP